MSRKEQKFVNVTVGLGESVGLAGRVRARLLADGYVEPGGQKRPDLATGKLDGDDVERYVLVEGGERQMAVYLPELEPPHCPACDAVFGHQDYLWGWFRGEGEPILTCAACCFEGAAGDWNCEYAGAVGNLIITVDGWSEAAEEFRRYLNRTGTGRWAYVYEHV